ncbi:MAG: PAS domain-containing protein [Burkholderiaceae bacterium]
MSAQLIDCINRTDTQTPSDAEPRLSSATGTLFADLPGPITAEQRDMIHMALDWVDAPLAFFDRSLVLQFANAAYCTLLGRGRATLIGMPFEDVAIEGQGDDPRLHAFGALAGESLDIDIDIPHRHHGAPGDIERLQYRPQHDAEGQVIGVLTTLHRLERRQVDQRVDPFDPAGSAVRQPDGGSLDAPMRAALRMSQEDVIERERKQRELIESLPLPLLFIGSDGLCKWANRAFCATFAVADAQVAGTAPEVLSGFFADASRDGLHQATGGKAHSVVRELSPGGGEPRWYRADFLPGFDRNDTRSGVYVLLTDVNETRLAALRLEESEAHFRGFTENIPETMVFLDRDERFRYVNESFIRRTGKTRSQLLGRTVEEALGRVVRNRLKESLGHAFAGESFTRQGGDMFGDHTEWREVRYQPFRNDAGDVEGLYVVSRSLEGEKRAERAVRERDERIHFLTDNLPAEIVYVDADLRLQYCNQRFLSDYGFTGLDDVVGKLAADVVGGAVVGETAAHAAAALRGERVTYERCATQHSGDTRWLSVSLVGDFAEDGSARGIYSIAYDITDSKIAADTRTRQQQWIEAFVENFPQPLSYVDPNGIHQFANRAYGDFVAKARIDIIGHTGASVFGRDVAVVFNPSFLRALAGERLHTEHEVPIADGSPRFLSADWLPDVDAGGAVRGVYVVVQDIGEAKQARLAYEESLREMQRAMDSVALPISFVDTDERLRFVNHTTTAWYGRSAEELIGMRMRDLMSAEDYRFAQPYILAALSGEAVQYEREMRYHDGARRWVLIRYVSTRDEHDVVTGFYTTATDIQSRKKQEIALQQANGLLTAHFENTPLASFTLDGSGHVTRWSSQAETLFGWPRHEVIERSFAAIGLVDRDMLVDFLPDESDPDTATGNTRLHIVEARRRDGSLVTCEWHIAALRNAAGRITSSLALIQDVSQRVEAERRLTEIAQRDTLTRLLNRNALEPTLRAFIERARQGNTGVAVLFLDLDHFKNINDTLGHRVGDLMLVEVAAILRRCVRAEDEVVRIGGDEFMVVIGHARPKAIAHETAQRITAALGAPIRVENQRLSVTSSIGIAVYPDHGRAPEALIRSADLAMYRAKETGKNRFEFFSALLAQRSERRSAVKGALSRALKKDALRLYFQPRVRISDNRIVGAEALLRWTDPRLGVVSPKEFIVIAEESGLIHELGLYVFRTACRQLRDWQIRGVPLGVLSVNFSAHQLLVATFIDEVDQVIEETGVDPRRIEVEITETSMLFDLDVTKNVIADLKHRGMRIAIDDFGTGFSSLSHLQQLDVDTLKIDQSFIRDMLHDSGDAAITTSVISLARGLKLSTTAEGVENAQQLRALRNAGCDCYQGFLFSPAIVVEDIEALLQNQGPADGIQLPD